MESMFLEVMCTFTLDAMIVSLFFYDEHFSYIGRVRSISTATDKVEMLIWMIGAFRAFVSSIVFIQVPKEQKQSKLPAYAITIDTRIQSSILCTLTKAYVFSS